MITRLFSFFTQKTSSASDIVKSLENERIEREIALQEAIWERRNAYKLAVARERYVWLVSGGILTAIISAVSAFTHKNILHTIPIPPIITTILYETHACYGNKSKVVRYLTDKISKESDFVPEVREIYIEELDARILREKETV